SHRAAASMGPRYLTAERNPSTALSRESRELQWGRGISPRKGRGCTLDPESSSCFNGAAVSHRGKDFGDLIPQLGVGGLQWGRGISPRKGALLVKSSLNTMRFNGAAVS